MMIRNNVLLVAALLTVVTLSTAHAGQNRTGNKKQVDQSVTTTEVNQTINDDDTAMLIYIREEEKVARDVYLTLAEIWDTQIFTNIATAEQKHMDAVARLLEQFSIDDPVVDDSISAFTNPELAGMYNDLVSQGEQSLMDALYAGALIEEVDILDLQDFIDNSDQAEIINVYESLMRGSRNHLRAFVGQIESYGIVYEAQRMNQQDVDTIVDSAMERGSEGKNKGRKRRH
ncbi:MAG TPA: DUF2202 domain-containing protein [Crenotrichaceae bacterium]|nr:DUF2202 domain-containing protein [Crenotrichaceae bacterium]